LIQQWKTSKSTLIFLLNL